MKFFRFWKSVSWFIFILFTTFLPVSGSKRIRLFVHADKVIHLLLFFVFSLLLISDARRFFQSSSTEKNVALVVILTGLMTASFTELVQYFLIVERSGSIADFLADISGILVGIGVYKMILWKSKWWFLYLFFLFLLPACLLTAV